MKKDCAGRSVAAGRGGLSFIVPLPRRENHRVQIGDTKIGIQTESSEKLPPQRSVLFFSLGGVLALVVGLRKT